MVHARHLLTRLHDPHLLQNYFRAAGGVKLDRQRDQLKHDHDQKTEQRHLDQPSDTDEDQDRLALTGHQVDVAQRLRDPHQRRDAGKDDQEGTKRGAKNIAPDRPHSRVPPPCPQPLPAKPGSP